ncbi:MAG: hypothetical protein Q9220_000148 [cf. Caloplaca sp. 1 TL-2023]
MTSKQPLYGAPRPSSGLHKSKEIPSSTSLAFTSTLSSLLAQSSSSSTQQTTTGRARPSKTRSDIFKTHNKNIQKRALADSLHHGPQQNRKQDVGGLDPADLHRSKRKMEEKARLYASMKRGDYIPPSNLSSGHNAEEHSLVDFDRKWAEQSEKDPAADAPSSSSGDDEGGSDSGAESLVDYEDEFGRQKRATRSERDRELRRLNAAQYAASQLASYSARPSAPSNIIVGDTIQSAAFNPSEQMDSLARKRDRSLTPPEEKHYDASSEIRDKGVGFYAFSMDEGERRREMGELEGMRGETERVKMEREGRKEEREREVEERRRRVAKAREEKLAERFLRGLE